jgi:predicted RNase H-like nuclease
VGRVAGADGCKGGWIAVEQEPGTDTCRAIVASSFEELLSQLADCDLVAVDIPIGLPEHGSRDCDVAARKFLSPHRGSSVFPAPIRPILDAGSHAEACEIREAIEGKRISVQVFWILAKIREVDSALRGTSRKLPRVVEVHPEVSFAAMAGGEPMHNKKARVAGREERLAHLGRQFPEPVIATALAAYAPGVVANDDICDALAALWSAGRVVEGLAQRFPRETSMDGAGLEMAIWY